MNMTSLREKPFISTRGNPALIMKCLGGHQPYRPCIYKQEDVKAKLLNPKSSNI